MGNASERRIERVKSLLHSALAEIIRDELADPRLGIHSLTELHLSRDLSHCEVLVAAVGGREASEAAAAVLNGAAPLLWNRLRQQTDLRTVPKLRFVADHRSEHADRVFELLEQLDIDAGAAAAAADADSPDADADEYEEDADAPEADADYGADADGRRAAAGGGAAQECAAEGSY